MLRHSGVPIRSRNPTRCCNLDHGQISNLEVLAPIRLARPGPADPGNTSCLFHVKRPLLRRHDHNVAVRLCPFRLRDQPSRRHLVVNDLALERRHVREGLVFT